MSNNKGRKRSRKSLTVRFIYGTLIGFLLYIWCINLEAPQIAKGGACLHIFLNGQMVGTMDASTGEDGWSAVDETNRLLVAARRSAALETDGIFYSIPSLEYRYENEYDGETDSGDVIISNMTRVLLADGIAKPQKGYTVKINEYMVNLPNKEDARSMLQAAVDKYDEEASFGVDLVKDTGRPFSVITANVNKRQLENNASELKVRDLIPAGGVQAGLADLSGILTYENPNKDLSEYETGVWDVHFAEEIEISEGYYPAAQMGNLAQAILEVTKESETASIYEVKAGDTLSQISIDLNLPLDTLIELNSDKLENERSVIHIGDKLEYTRPEADFSVQRAKREYIEETYDEPIQYIDRDDWYTTQTNVIQQPSAGFRRALVDIFYNNDKESHREILMEDIVMAAVPKIMERGTKVPPSYVKPISGGRLSSGFGKRKAPKAGASTYHKGVDWATPVGTPVYASCGGTVAKAGWGSGYGYVVYIDHADGRQTRYGHLSKVLVSVGDTVKQGDKIALSGNTGVSTGAHLHFEILIDGSQVNPFDYLE